MENRDMMESFFLLKIRKIMVSDPCQNLTSSYVRQNALLREKNPCARYFYNGPKQIFFSRTNHPPSQKE